MIVIMQARVTTWKSRGRSGTAGVPHTSTHGSLRVCNKSIFCTIQRFLFIWKPTKRNTYNMCRDPTDNNTNHAIVSSH